MTDYTNDPRWEVLAKDYLMDGSHARTLLAALDAVDPARQELASVWPHIRAIVERASNTYYDEPGHDLSPWSFDASELPGALDYIGTVLAHLPLPAPPEAIP